MPTLTVQPASKDNFVDESEPTTNYGTNETLWAWDLLNFLQHTLLHFGISSVPSGASIISATLSLYCFIIVGDANSIGVYKLTQPTWHETQSTWNIYKTGNSWDTAGGDFVTSNPSSGSATPSADAWMEVDVQAIVQDAVDNSLDVHLLAKFITEGQTGATDSHPRFRSSNYTADTTQRPKLVIAYSQFPSDPVARVSSIRHIFRPGLFVMQAGLGDLGFDIDIAETTVRSELDTAKAPEGTVKEQVDRAAKELGVAPAEVPLTREGVPIASVSPIGIPAQYPVPPGGVPITPGISPELQKIIDAQKRLARLSEIRKALAGDLSPAERARLEKEKTEWFKR